MGKKKKPLSHIEVLRKLARSGLQESPPISRPVVDGEGIATLEERVALIFGTINRTSRRPTDMIFFVMYDIESNKVRRLVAKYLIDKGCTRIQNSIFLADLPKPVCDTIKVDLAEVQALYDNHDSIIVCPISTDQLYAMHIIGQKIDIDIITNQRNTLFF